MQKPAITQAMIDAYDEYTHLTLDRRGFMDRLTKLAGSGAAAAAIAPLATLSTNLPASFALTTLACAVLAWIAAKLAFRAQR